MEYATVPVNEIVHSRYSSEYSRSYSQDTFLELTNSIRAMGIHNPICVTRKNAEGKHVIIDGDHRLAAAVEAGLETVPVRIDLSVDPDKAGFEEKVLNYINNTQRVNLKTYETATLFRKMFDDCSFLEVEEAKARMGISRYKAELFSKLNALDEESGRWLAKMGMDSNPRIIDALLSIRKKEDREDTISRAESLGILEQKEMEDFLESVGAVIGSFPEVIRIHFNARELPYSKTVAKFLLLYPTEERILAAVDKLNSVPAREKTNAAAQFIRLLKGIDPSTGELRSEEACPELLDLVVLPAFPYDDAAISAVIRFRNLFPDSPEKRLCIFTDLVSHNRMTEDDLIRLSHSIEKIFSGFPEEVQKYFWDGRLPFNDACFRILNILLEKTYDLPTKLEMIESACSGKITPEQFENRLAKAIRERDEMIREIALQTNTDPASLKNDEDIMRTTGIPEEDIARIRSGSSAGLNKDPEKKKTDDTCQDYSYDAADDQDEDESYESYDSVSGYLLLADSMAKSQNTDKHIELELLAKGENESIRILRLYRIADQICRKCRKERIFDFKTVNYCQGCMLACLIGEVEDSIGEEE